MFAIGVNPPQVHFPHLEEVFSNLLTICSSSTPSPACNPMKDALQSPKNPRKNPAKATIIQKKSTAKSVKFKSRAQSQLIGTKIPETQYPNNDENDDKSLIPRSSLPTFLQKNPILASDFYQIDALELAPLLLGKYLRRDDVVLQITEVEAYRPNDSACHGRFGITSRTAPVFGPGGHAYVYLCYGLHTMLNIVADKEGAGAAVLVRACAPISGMKIIQQRRGILTEKPVLLTGPGKVGQALGISTEWSNHCLFTPGGLELLDGPRPENILVGPRVGIEYALPEHVNALWRFAVAGSPWISAPKTTLGPP
ncbi:OLC1v1038208C1 [Oldenlandia corymbosa var. corymbosa]|uniref:DNA-3-methyladenine glycosylase II n=1 Tax=Oldenlandia corymbosa var. corymbosa TaxID=529605 RepID=A0AAV1CZE1_OLDCO|nr:OLC1v1038208C1 [Oldenlandia corymbosa var. corymbosa]